jgi:hypothetical protein
VKPFYRVDKEHWERVELVKFVGFLKKEQGREASEVEEKVW